MTTFTRLFLSILIFISSGVPSVPAGAAGEQVVTLKLPEAIIAETIRQSLPIEINTPSESLGGSIVIQKIEQLTFADQSLSALLVLVGKDVKIKTAIAGHQLLLNIGNVLLDFTMSATVRYDRQSQTLFVKPTVTRLNSQGDQKKDEIGNLLVSLLDGREFPVAIDKLQPLAVDAGSRKLAIDMQVIDVIITREALFLHILPSVHPLPKQTS